MKIVPLEILDKLCDGIDYGAKRRVFVDAGSRMLWWQERCKAWGGQGAPFRYLPGSLELVDFSEVGTGLPRTRGLTGGGRISTKRLLQYLDEIAAHFSVDPEDLKSILSVKHTVKIESE